MNNFSLLENGFDYIINSLNNLKKLEENKGNKYTIKYIIRDLISGIEIILKYRLECDNWAFVIDNLDKLTLNSYKEGDFISVTLEQSIDRLIKLCNVVIKKDEIATLKELKSIRNKIEHFRLTLKEEETISLVYNCITVIIKFVDRNPENFEKKFTKDETNVYLDIKKRILNLNNYLNQTEKEIHNKYPGIDFKTCPKCHKKSVKVNHIECECYLCGINYSDTTYERKKYIEKNQPSYREISQGAPQIEEIECPFCNDVMLIDYENDKAICFMCNEESCIDDIDNCERCGKFGVTGICDDCLEDMALMQWEISRGK